MKLFLSQLYMEVNSTVGSTTKIVELVITGFFMITPVSKSYSKFLFHCIAALIYVW